MLLIVHSIRRIFLIIASVCIGPFLFGQPVLSFTPFVTGLSGAVDIVNAGDGTNRLFIVQKNGTIRIHNGTSLLPASFINLADTVLDSGEQGLLSLAFHPDYENNRYFFVWYTDKEGDLTLARYQTSAGNPNVADPNSEVVLLEIPKPGTPYFTNHNGGKINFGPDGYLYVSIGDGGSGGDPFGLSQNGNSLLGKMLRLDANNFNTPPYYSIPPDNPFVSDPTVRDEVWVLGLRNPWRWSFDRLTGDMWIGDVGQGLREEVNYRPAGATGGVNYGWRCYEGSLAYNTSGCAAPANYIFPIFDYPHNNSTGGFSITGGHVYRGTDFPFLIGYYLVADYVSGNVWKIRPNGSGGWQSFIQTGLPGNISGFGEAENGRLYAVSLGGTVYTVESNSFLPLKLTDFTASLQGDKVTLSWKTVFETGLDYFAVETSTDAMNFSTIGKVKATNNTNGSVYQFTHSLSRNSTNYFRIRSVEQDQQFKFSPTIKLNSSKFSGVTIQPSIVANRQFSVRSEFALQTVRIVGMDGVEVFRQSMGDKIGLFSVTIPAIQPGIYILSCLGSKGELFTQKLVIQ